MKKYLTYAIAILFATNLAAFASPEQEAIEVKEKAAWQAFKDKKSDDFKKLLSPNLVAVYADGILTLQDELDMMQKVNMKSFTISDMKVTMTNADTAIVSYKVKVASSMDGKDTSGDHNAASVWQKKDGDWQAVLHTDVKAEPAMGTDTQKKE